MVKFSQEREKGLEQLLLVLLITDHFPPLSELSITEMMIGSRWLGCWLSPDPHGAVSSSVLI